MPPSQYLTGVWAAKLRLNGVQSVSANGLNAATGYTQVRTNSGSTVVLRLAAVSWPDGNIYRFQFISPPAAARQNDPGFMETLRSFRKLSSREAAGFKPFVVRPYKVKRGDTVASVAGKLPFDKLTEERLRVLNGLDGGQQLTPGTWIKVVAAR